MNVNETNRFDIVICGGSFVGLALARALTAMAPGGYRIAVVEQRPLELAHAGAGDGRTVALTSAVKAMLESIGVWPALADKRAADPSHRADRIRLWRRRSALP